MARNAPFFSNWERIYQLATRLTHAKSRNADRIHAKIGIKWRRSKEFVHKSQPAPKKQPTESERECEGLQEEHTVWERENCARKESVWRKRLHQHMRQVVVTDSKSVRDGVVDIRITFNDRGMLSNFDKYPALKQMKIPQQFILWNCFTLTKRKTRITLRWSGQ